MENVAVRPPSYKEHTVVEGRSYTIPCGTTVDADVRWNFKSSVTGSHWKLYDQGRVWEQFRPRFSLNTSVPLLYSLDISNVQLNDTGNYTCIGGVGQGDKHIHNLSVQGKCRPHWRCEVVFTKFSWNRFHIVRCMVKSPIDDSNIPHNVYCRAYTE